MVSVYVKNHVYFFIVFVFVPKFAPRSSLLTRVTSFVYNRILAVFESNAYKVVPADKTIDIKLNFNCIYFRQRLALSFKQTHSALPVALLNSFLRATR